MATIILLVEAAMGRYKPACKGTKDKKDKKDQRKTFTAYEICDALVESAGFAPNVEDVQFALEHLVLRGRLESNEPNESKGLRDQRAYSVRSCKVPRKPSCVLTFRLSDKLPSAIDIIVKLNDLHGPAWIDDVDTVVQRGAVVFFNFKPTLAGDLAAMYMHHRRLFKFSFKQEGARRWMPVAVEVTIDSNI
tara:strand:+ start:1991 stop:2563 length:573 start_codon:yes stop_codon:yes gene_type:complete